MNNKTYNVLFLCTGNSARSIMAEAILNRLGHGKFKAYSAGSYPEGQVNPAALTVLEHLNFDTAGLRSKSWDEFAGQEAPRMDFVFTVSDNAANEVSPVWPGQPMMAHWGIPDPAVVKGTESEKQLAYRDAYRMLASRISIFVNLPLTSIDRLALQQRLDDIGTSAEKTV